MRYAEYVNFLTTSVIQSHNLVKIFSIIEIHNLCHSENIRKKSGIRWLNV